MALLVVPWVSSLNVDCQVLVVSGLCGVEFLDLSIGNTPAGIGSRSNPAAVVTWVNAWSSTAVARVACHAVRAANTALATAATPIPTGGV